MKKLLYLFLTVLIVACSGEDSNNQDNNDGDNNNDTTCEYVLNTLPVTNLGMDTANLNGIISINSNCEFPITEQGFVYATTIQPTTANNKINVNGTDVTSTIENLEPNTTYYVRTFLTNTLGDFYGNEVSFMTVEEQPCEYNLITQEATIITSDSATLNGTISIEDNENCDLPNTEQGFVYATTIQPTIANTQVNVSGTEVTTTIENLEPNTTYYVRTFLTNDLGEFYGNEVSFMTTEEPDNCDDNPVPSIIYGTQEWTVKNHCKITYRDGTPIPRVEDNDEWISLTTGAWCYYNNDPTKGRLYNWYAVMGVHDADPSTPNKEFAPEGWHVPSKTEWTTLIDYLIANGYNYDGTTSGNKIAKSVASTTGWSYTTGGGEPGWYPELNNSSGFNAFPVGARIDIGDDDFRCEGSCAIFWDSSQHTEPPLDRAWYTAVYNIRMDVEKFVRLKWNGLSVRFVKN